MIAALAQLCRAARDPAALCRIVGEAMKSDSTISAGVLAAVEANSDRARDLFITLGELNEAEAEIVRALPFLWLPAGEREVATIFTEGDRRGEWGIFCVSALAETIRRASAVVVDPYSAAVARQKKPQLRLVVT